MTDNKQTLLKGVGLSLTLLVIAIILWKFVLSKEQITQAIEYINSFGPWSFVMFALIYVVMVSLSFPSSIFNIAAGVIFPLWGALPLAYACGLGAASVTFFLARFWLRDKVIDRVKKLDNGEGILEIVEEDSAKVIILLRLNTFIPAVVKNYGLGVTDLRFCTYALYTFLGQIPLASMYVYLGWFGGLAMLNSESSPETVHFIVLGLGFLTSLGIVIWSRLYFKKSLQSA